jgi:putative redox protein
MYAERKGWDIGKIRVNVSQKEEQTSSGIKKWLTEDITFEKEVTEEQRKRLLIIAGKCPVAKMVKGETEIVSNIL